MAVTEKKEELLSPEQLSKSLVRDEYEQLVAQRDFFGWELRLHDAGDFYVIFVRMSKVGGREFLMRLRCDDFPQIAPEQSFIDPGLFDSADEDTPGGAEFYPAGSYVDLGRGPLPVLCIKGHRDYYASGWHDGWTNPPAHDHSLYQHVVNVRNAISSAWE